MSTEEFDLPQWRQSERQRLIEARKAIPEDERRTHDRALTDWLTRGFAALAGTQIGFCWPIASEPDPRFAIRRWREEGSRVALPVVVAPRTPLAFREWWPGAPVEHGVYDIPYPVGTEELTLDAALVPGNGIDDEGCRLGYGGGFFDRTLADAATKPICILLGYELSRIPTIHPQPHDIPFDFAVTEAGIAARIDGRLTPVAPETASEHLRELQRERGIA